MYYKKQMFKSFFERFHLEHTWCEPLKAGSSLWLHEVHTFDIVISLRHFSWYFSLSVTSLHDLHLTFPIPIIGISLSHFHDQPLSVKALKGLLTCILCSSLSVNELLMGWATNNISSEIFYTNQWMNYWCDESPIIYPPKSFIRISEWITDGMNHQ